MKCVESIEIEIDPTYDFCKMTLEHRSGDKACYWLYVDIGFHVGTKRVRGYTVQNVSKQAVKVVLAELKAAGLSKVAKAAEREWEYWTIMR